MVGANGRIKRSLWWMLIDDCSVYNQSPCLLWRVRTFTLAREDNDLNIGVVTGNISRADKAVAELCSFGLAQALSVHLAALSTKLTCNRFLPVRGFYSATFV
jgi:hypothetical protein